MDLWQSRRWRLLLNVVDHLPRNSWYGQAVADDEDYAQMLLDLEKQREKSGARPVKYHPPIREWSAEREGMANLEDRMIWLGQILLGVNGNPAPKNVHASRPMTAMDRLRGRQRLLAHNALVARVKRDSAEYQLRLAASDGETITVDSPKSEQAQD